MTQVTPQQWVAMGATTNYEDHSMFYRDEGDAKDALVLLHGFPTASWDWHVHIQNALGDLYHGKNKL